MFQRIAGVEESAAEILGADWDNWNKPRRARELDRIITHRVIQNAAGRPRNN